MLQKYVFKIKNTLRYRAYFNEGVYNSYEVSRI